MDWITRIPPDIFEKTMANNILLAEKHGARYGQLLRVGGMIDQKLLFVVCARRPSGPR